jgi:hypothetical protein
MCPYIFTYFLDLGSNVSKSPPSKNRNAYHMVSTLRPGYRGFCLAFADFEGLLMEKRLHFTRRSRMLSSQVHGFTGAQVQVLG